MILAGWPLQAFWRFGWEPHLVDNDVVLFLFKTIHTRNSYIIWETPKNSNVQIFNIILIATLRDEKLVLAILSTLTLGGVISFWWLWKKLTLGENLLRDEFFGITRCICDDAMIFVLYIIFSICTVFRVFRITLSGAEMVFWPCQASIWPCRLFWLIKLKQGNWYIGMIVIITCHRKNRGQKSAEVVKKTSPTTGRTPTRWFSGDVWSEPEADVCNQKDCWLEWWLASEISEIMGSDVVVSKYF